MKRLITGVPLQSAALRSGLASPVGPEPFLRARLEDVEATETLVTLLAAPGGLTERREAGRRLLQLLYDCPDVESCRQVIGALGQLGERRAVAALVTRLKNPMVQRASIRALGKIDGPESIAALIDCLLHDERSLARIEAARALRSSGIPWVKYSLWQAVLRDPEPAVRDAAWMTLSDIAASARRP